MEIMRSNYGCYCDYNTVAAVLQERGAMRIENVRELPLCYQEQIAAQILEKLAAAAPEILEKVNALKATCNENEGGRQDGAADRI